MFKSPGMHCTGGKSEGDKDIMTSLSSYFNNTDLGLSHPILITDGRLGNGSL